MKTFELLGNSKQTWNTPNTLNEKFRPNFVRFRLAGLATNNSKGPFTWTEGAPRG